MFLLTEITASPSVSPLLAANSIFSISLKRCLHLCLLNSKFLSHFANRRYFHFKRHLQIDFDLVFTTESVKTPPSLFGLSWSSYLISWLVLTFGLLLNGWNDFQTMTIYFDCATWFLWYGIEHIKLWVIFDFIRVMVDLVLYNEILTIITS